MIFDSHAHYNDRQFDEDRDRLIPSLPARGIDTVVNVGDTMEGSRQSLALAEKYEFIFASVGVHPEEIGELDGRCMDELSELADRPETVAIGEIGLDYHGENPDRDRQRYWFEEQIRLAERKNMPVIIHSRDAAADTMEIVKKAADRNGGTFRAVMHCFSYSPEIALDCVRLGLVLGAGGVVTFKNARKMVETVKTVDMSRILLETDCPYLAPVPHRGQRNSSLYLPLVAEKIGEIKEMSAEQVCRITRENACRFYGLVR